MKKAIALFLVLTMTVTALTGCFGSDSSSSSSPTPAKTSGQTAKPTETPKTTPTPIPAGKTLTPSESYVKYVEVKSAALEALTESISDAEEGWVYLFTLLPLSLVDLSMLPLSLIGVEGDDSSDWTMGFLGMAGYKWETTDNGYLIEYTDEEGAYFKMTCEYDAATDSMKSYMSATETESSFFEFARAGDGYVSQYYTQASDGEESSLIKCYFDSNGNIAFNMTTSDKEPATIYKKTGFTAAFVEEVGTYMAMIDGVMRISEDGVLQLGN